MSEPVHIAIRILVLIFPTLFIVGILAAIAIPAFQSYRTKAEAAKSTVSIEVPVRAPIVIPAAQRHDVLPKNPVLVRAAASRV